MPGERVIVPGPPGTGKTTRCLREVDDALREGVRPERVAYVSFTRSAVQEARDRACHQFALERERLPFFRTLHSLALYLMGASSRELLSRDQLRELGELLGESLSGFDALNEDGEPRARRPGTTAMFLDQLARTTGSTLQRAYAELPPHDRPPWRLVERAARAYERFREDTGALDFTDLLEIGAEHAEPPDLDLAIVDEAQDLTPLQWRFAWRVLERARRVVIAGDDDQALFVWSGADPSVFIELEGRVDPLTQSHRLPGRVHRLATRVSRSIRQRREKAFNPRDAEGAVHHHRLLGSVPVEGTDGSWLMLARHGSGVLAACRELDERGVAYATRRGHCVPEEQRRALVAFRAWCQGDPATAEDARAALRLTLGKAGVPPELPEMVEPGSAGELGVEGLRDATPEQALLSRVADRRDHVRLSRLLRRGEDPVAEPRVAVSTIHGAKGREADHVALSARLNRRTAHAWYQRPDDERRVLYVGVTRASRTLHLVAGGSRHEYPLSTFDAA